MSALGFFLLYRVAPVFAGQLALREFARRGARAVPAWSASRARAHQALVTSRLRNGDLGWRVVMLGYVESLERASKIAGGSLPQS